MDQIGVRGFKADGSYDIIPTRKHRAIGFTKAGHELGKPAAAAVLSGPDQPGHVFIHPMPAPQYRKIGIYQERNRSQLATFPNI